MKYPRINKEKLDGINRKRFDVIKKEIQNSIEFDNQENELGLTKKDIELLSWNCATNLIIFCLIGI
jgi:hypothetical protein